MHKHIPNGLTLLNLSFGCVAILAIAGARDNLYYLPYILAAALLADLLDGLVARWLQVTSSIGKELDSLADMVSFGLVPGYLLYVLIGMTGAAAWLSLFGFIYTLAAAVRLARFNVDTRQSVDFIGLPTPAAALFVLGIYPLQEHLGTSTSHWILIFMAAFLAFLMNAPIRLFSLKWKGGSWQHYWPQIILIIVGIIIGTWLLWAALPIIIMLYVLLAVLNNVISKL